MFCFDWGLERLRTAGFQRYPRLSEAFSLIIDCLEGKLQGLELRKVFGNMLESSGEWLILAFECRGDVLIAYVDPENLRWNAKEGVYEVNGETLTCADQHEFDITGQPSEQGVPLRTLNSDLVTFLYSRLYDQLPQQIQNEGRLWLPPEGVVLPVARTGFDCRFGVFGVCVVGAVRGVRSASA